MPSASTVVDRLNSMLTSNLGMVPFLSLSGVRYAAPRRHPRGMVGRYCPLVGDVVRVELARASVLRVAQPGVLGVDLSCLLLGEVVVRLDGCVVGSGAVDQRRPIDPVLLRAVGADARETRRLVGQRPATAAALADLATEAATSGVEALSRDGCEDLGLAVADGDATSVLDGEVAAEDLVQERASLPLALLG